MTPAEHIEGYRLSIQQQRLHRLQDASPSTPYRVQGLIEIEGPLDRERLGGALARVAERHEILRTRFQRLPAMVLPVQVVHQLPCAIASEVDISCLTVSEQTAREAIVWRECGAQSIAWTRQLALHTVLLRLGPAHHALFVTLSALCADPATLTHLVTELADAYGAGQGVGDSDVVQYADYAEWQHQVLSSGDAGGAGFWRAQAHAELITVRLPFENGEGAPRPFLPSVEQTSLPLSLGRAIHSFARAHGTAVEVCLLGCWLALLRRHRGQGAQIVGVLSDGRSEATRGALGPYSKVLPIRFGMDLNASFKPWLSHLAKLVAGARRWQDGFAWQPDSACCAASFAYVPALKSAVAGPVCFTLARQHGLIDRFKLQLAIAEQDHALSVQLHYDPACFSSAAIACLLSQFETLVAGALKWPDTPLRDLDLATASERKRLLTAFNQTEAAAAPCRLLHQLFEAQAQRTPAAIALIAGEMSLSYAALDAKANRLTHYLRSRGIGPDERVGICFGRSPDALVAMLGVLKAGAAYVPLDPDYPTARLAYMLKDAGIALVLTHAAHADFLRSQNSAHVCLDREEALLRSFSGRSSGVACDPENLAYVIYTSGSTGLPKGVALTHCNVLHSTTARLRYYREPVRCFLLLSSFSFDSSVAGIYWTLSQGGSLCLAPEEALQEPAALADLIEEHRVSHVLGLPSFYHAFLETVAPGRLRSLKTVIVAGEACSKAVVARHWAMLPDVPLFNEYGPTECAVWSSVYPCVQASCGSVAIGRPIGGWAMYVLDERLEPAPTGIAGEICIGGAGLGRGYLRQPAFTAQRFIPNPFGGSGTRLYRTGDLGCYSPGGHIEFLGRADQQVKLRGYRVELAEIEAALCRLAGVTEAAVVARDGSLLAYVARSNEAVASADGLRDGLRERLPDYMVPARFVFLERLPHTPNGKLDRNALPVPEEITPASTRYAPPRTPVEEALARLWAELLRLERVGIHDNFFELGGDSILSIQIVGRARQAGLRFTARQMVEHQTIAALAGVVQSTAQKTEAASSDPGEVPLTPIQRWFFEQDLPRPERWTHALLLRLTQPVDGAALTQAVDHVIRHHDALRLRFIKTGGKWRQWSRGSEGCKRYDNACEHVDLTAADDKQLAMALQHAAQKQMDIRIASGPLFKLVWFDAGRTRPDHLLVVTHHLVADGLSWRILLEDLHSAYRQLTAGQAPMLPPQTTSFHHWARGLQAYARSEAVKAEQTYWLDAQQFRVDPLPVDHPEGDNTAAANAVLRVMLGEDDTQALLQDVPPVYQTRIDDVLLCALALTLCRWSGAGAVLVDLDRHGREIAIDGMDVSRTVGWFTSVFPMPLSVSLDAGLGANLKSIKEQLRSVPHQGSHYGLLRHGLGEIARRLSELPAAQVIFNYLGQLDQTFAQTPLFAFSEEHVLSGQDPAWARSYELAIGVDVYKGRLRVDWDYSAARYKRETIAALADGYLAALRQLIGHCLSAEAGGYTPSDFPLAGLSQDELDALFSAQPGIEDVYPATPVQAGMLFHSRFAAQSGVYLQQVSCNLEGPFDRGAFIQAWQAVLDKYTVLRSAFIEDGQQRQLQVVHRRVGLPILEHDWREMAPEAEVERRWQTLLTEDRAQGFTVAQAPLMRLTLVRCDQTRHRLLWSHHHALLDGWCPGIIFNEVIRAYEGLYSGARPTLGPSRAYRDYVDWLLKQDREIADAYWRRTLAGFDSPTPLGIARTPDVPGRGHGEQRMALTAKLTEELISFARHHRLTPNTLVQGAWAILLGRYGGARDVVFGITVSGRPADLAGTESMVGLFINTLPLRIRISPQTPVLEWLQALMRQNAELRELEYSAPVDVHACSDVPRAQPLFESIVVFENYPVERALLEARSVLGVKDVRFNEQTHYPLTVVAVPGEALELRIAYERGRFDAPTMERLLGNLQTLLTAMIGDPGVRLGALSMVTDTEQRRFSRLRIEAVSVPSAGETLRQRFEASVSRGPDAVALVCEGQSLTYAELNRRAERLAARLRESGAGAETRIGLCLSRGPGLIVAIIGILKAGAAYVPLDPAHPRARLEAIMKDSGAAMLVTEQALLTSLPECANLCVDGDIGQAHGQRHTAPHSDQDNAAYVIYTSGTTGWPKGVVVTHRNVLRLFDATAGELGFNDRDVWTLFHSYAFDFSVWELWGALLYGGRLVVVPPRVARSPEDLHELLGEQGITVLNQTPSSFYQLQAVDSEQPARLSSLRLVIFGGEALDPRRLHPWVQRHGDQKPRLVNMYGITETSVHVTWQRLYEEHTHHAASVIGRPIADMKTLILDVDGHPVPIGVPGQLHVGGAGLARGYLGRPDLTAQRFVPDPFGADGARLYCSGDLARLSEDGGIEYLGRIDHQVQVRGYRIELGEIEAGLRSHPDVSDACVVACEDRADERRLVAYVVAEQAKIDAAVLRLHLQQRLPDPMVPAAYVFVPVLPLTPNGKLDRKALPPPDGDASQPYIAPRRPLENEIAAIWAEVLRVERVGIDQDFFVLGGHSLLAAQMIGRIAKRFPIDLPIEALYEHPTVETLAAAVESALLEHLEALPEHEARDLLARVPESL